MNSDQPPPPHPQSLFSIWRRRSNLTRQIPLRLPLVVPFVLQIFAAVGLTGWLSLRNGQKAVNNLASQLRSEVTARIEQKLDNYLEKPQRLNQLIVNAIERSQLSLQLDQPNPQNEFYLWQQIKLFEEVTWISLGSEKGGEYFAITRQTQEKKNEPPLQFAVANESTNYFTVFYESDAQSGKNTNKEVRKADKPYDSRTRPWYTGAVEAGKPIWTEIYPDLVLPRLYITTSRPVYDKENNLLGVSGIDLSLEDISSFLLNLKVGESGETFIIERTGELVAQSIVENSFISEGDTPKRIEASDSSNPLIKATGEYLKKQFGDFTQINKTIKLNFQLDGERQFVQVRPYISHSKDNDKKDDDWRIKNGPDWLIVVVVPEAEFMAEINANTRTTIGLCLGALVIATAVGIITSRWITQPILRLSAVAGAIASGKLDQKVELGNVKELNILACSFNKMAKQLRGSFDELETRVQQRTASLTQAEAELRGLFAAMTELIFVKDEQGRYLKVISSKSELLYKPAEELLNKLEHEILPPEQADIFVGYIREALQTQQTVQVEYNLILGGQEVWFAASISPITENSVIWVAHDITDRKQVEEALIEKEAYLRLILDNIPQQVFWKDTNLVFLGCNRNWAEAAKLENPEAVVGLTDYDLLPKAVADSFRAKDRQIMEADQPELHHIDVKQKPGEDGQKRWLDINKIPYHDAQGKVIGILGVIDDITQRRQAEEALRIEQEKSEQLLLNILPEPIANRLKQDTSAIAEQFDETTIMFADIVGFTPLSAKMPPTELVKLLNQVFSLFDQLAEQHGLEKIKTIGDAYMVVGGLPVAMPNHAEAIANMALDMQRAIDQFQADIGESFQIRIGINTGSVVAGVIGIKKFIYDLWGDAVNVASRMESSGVPGKIQVTTQTYKCLQDKYVLEKRGEIQVKGKGEMTTYWLIDRR
ncbi:MAG: PAS domain-containing protein [Symploca sp. SIO2G7]|nr:PAS domain-containing protein [Symploca sp. SIO2G7]